MSKSWLIGGDVTADADADAPDPCAIGDHNESLEVVWNARGGDFGTGRGTAGACKAAMLDRSCVLMAARRKDTPKVFVRRWWNVWGI